MKTVRRVPSVESVLISLRSEYPTLPHSLLKSETVEALEELRQGGDFDPAARVRERIAALRKPSLRRVINATGVVLHTNLGRAPLGSSGYCNLEYDLATGRRGRRDDHIAGLLRRLLGVDAIAVNNNAAAVYLALNELAAGSEVIVSRGELIEIGDGFRIPDIMRRAGVVLVEAGTTNRTSIDDYRSAINANTRLLLRVHPSNFTVSGFHARPSLAELTALSRECGVPLYEDLGSGCVVDLRPFGIHEPLVRESLDAGVSLVSFSCDKLLGGPQAGILAGDAPLIKRLRANPMYRALRLDKLVLEALEANLRALVLGEIDSIPALRMLAMPLDAIRARAERFAGETGGEVTEGQSLPGGGATPDQSLPTVLAAFSSANANKLEQRLRAGDPPVVARIENGRLLIDLRTVAAEEQDALAAAIRAALV